MPGLQDLPPEILRRVCQYALPHSLTLSFKPGSTWDIGDPVWFIYVEHGWSRRRLGKQSRCREHTPDEQCYCGDELSEAVFTAGTLPQVCKSIAAEARAIFFSANTFVITIDSKAHRPVSLKSPLIFGPFGMPHRLHLLRDLRQLELDVLVSEHNTWAIRRQHARIQYFTDILRQHSNDQDKKALLKRLHVTLRPENNLRNHGWCWWIEARGLFVLEPLAALTGIEQVNVTSPWHIGWFQQCLSMRIRGEGGELKELEWPMKTIKHLKSRHKFKRPVKDTVSSWKPGRPTLDWFEFARRNGIEVPARTHIHYPQDYVDGQ